VLNCKIEHRKENHILISFGVFRCASVLDRQNFSNLLSESEARTDFTFHVSRGILCELCVSAVSIQKHARRSHMASVMTVCGPVSADSLGIILSHEHLFIDLRNQFSEFGDPKKKAA
jgi:hypothetical protein